MTLSLKYKKANPNDVDFIIGMLSQIYPVSTDLAQEFKKHAITVTLKPSEHILHEGDFCKYIYFIKSGAMMGYTHHYYKQIVTYISVENEFISSLSGLYGESPSRESIKAIEPTILLGVHTSILLGWYDKFFDLNFIIRKVYESYYRDAQERSHIIRIGDAKERYTYFAQTNKSRVDRLPTEILASFLDMKPQTLQRVKKELERESLDAEVLIASITDFLVANELFRNKTLNINSFALVVQINPKQILYCIRRHLKLNFKDFINSYRISYFKKLYSEEHNLKNFTIESLAMDSGFSSRSSFYLAYKKLEGTFPRNLRF